MVKDFNWNPDLQPETSDERVTGRWQRRCTYCGKYHECDEDGTIQGICREEFEARAGKESQ